MNVDGLQSLLWRYIPLVGNPIEGMGWAGYGRPDGHWIQHRR